MSSAETGDIENKVLRPSCAPFFRVADAREATLRLQR
jgi:hypothetical protein